MVRQTPKQRLRSRAGSRRSATGCARALTSAWRPRWWLPPLPSTVCWSWAVPATFAPPEARRGLGLLRLSLDPMHHGFCRSIEMPMLKPRSCCAPTSACTRSKR
jgi:hypothetical protein